METLSARFTDIMPDRIKALPIDHRGFPVPWFVAWPDGKPDHRVIDSAKIWPAINQRRCWLCGQPLGSYLTFPIGPMGAITRTTSEPPSHRDCAEFAAKVWPFLTIPAKGRRDKNLPDDATPPPGEYLTRNPGAIALWICKRYEVRMVDDGLLFTVGQPTEVLWYAEGRAATRQEVEDSMASGLPALIQLAKQDGEAGLQELNRQLMIAQALLPAALLPAA
jgi:hypothetical protein